MCDSIPSARYFSVCNVLHQWRIWLIPTYTMVVFKMCDSIPSARYFSVVMYCINGESGSSLLIESTDFMIIVLYERERKRE